MLQRLTRPDYPNLVAVIQADLAYKNSGGFGSLKIHSLLTLAQLDELAKNLPSVLTNNTFVTTYASRLLPNPDVDFKHDDKEHEAYLDRLWAFVSKLGPAFNNLKAQVLFQRL